MDSPPLLVIGSNSISGASFVRHAIEQGRRVIGVSRSAELPGCFLPYRWAAEAAQARFSFHQMDLNHHAAGILDLVSDARCACVVNFAAQSMVAESWLNPEQWYQTNVVANVRLHDGLRKIPSLRRYVHISTPEVYGSCEGTVRENETYRPSTPYAASRAACDLHLRTFFQRYDFPVCLTRAANVYGPGQQLYRIIPRTVMAVLTGEKLQLQGGGHSVRSFIHLDDVAEATLRVADAGTSGETYHISTSRFVSCRRWCGMRITTSRTSTASADSPLPRRRAASKSLGRRSENSARMAARSSRVSSDEDVAVRPWPPRWSRAAASSASPRTPRWRRRAASSVRCRRGRSAGCS